MILGDSVAMQEVKDGLHPSARFRQVSDLDVNEVPDGYVVYQAATERVHFLNPTAALIFELCNGEHSVNEIESIVRTAFDLREPADSLIAKCVVDLLQQTLILPRNPLSQEHSVAAS
jgi:hypothetical protein